jgi:hypothetical protein
MTSNDAALAAINVTTKDLYLTTVRAEAEPLAAAALREQRSHLAYRADVLTAEVDARAERRRQRRIKEAKFPRTKRLADFDTTYSSINGATLAALATGTYLDAGEPSCCSATPAPARPTCSSDWASPPARWARPCATPPART